MRLECLLLSAPLSKQSAPRVASPLQDELPGRQSLFSSGREVKKEALSLNGGKSHKQIDGCGATSAFFAGFQGGTRWFFFGVGAIFSRLFGRQLGGLICFCLKFRCVTQQISIYLGNPLQPVHPRCARRLTSQAFLIILSHNLHVEPSLS